MGPMAPHVILLALAAFFIGMFSRKVSRLSKLTDFHRRYSIRVLHSRIFTDIRLTRPT